MNEATIHRLPGSQRRTRVPASALAGHAELARLSVSELEQLRRALALALGQVELGSPPSRLLGRLSRQTRSELRRRQPGPGGRSAA